MNTLQLIQPDNQIATIDQHHHDFNWLNYFSPSKALEQVAAHIVTLGSTGTTNNTKKIYNSGLKYFFEWTNCTNLQHPFPDAEYISTYIAHLSHDKPTRSGKGISARTIASKYLAPLRLYLQKLRIQRIEQGDPLEIIKYKNHLDEALAIRNPKPKKSTNQSALYAHGNRLTKSQVDELFMSCNLSTLRGKRNYALLYTAFTVALRVSELRKLTLDDINQTEKGYECTVTGKRNNSDPVFMDATCVQLIRDWITAYNQPFDDDDPRRITNQTPIWQPLNRGNNRKNNHKASEGISRDGISKLLASISESVLGFSISPHDCRRSYAAMARINGIEMDAIQTQLRHASIATTQIYVGALVDRSKSSLSAKVTFATPPKQPAQLELGA